MQLKTSTTTVCYHCGEKTNQPILAYDKEFCCTGCKSVYEILNKTGMCNYYNLAQHPGVNQKQTINPEKFSFLDNEKIAGQLISFTNQNQTHVTFYLPQMHCSSCLWLLENLHTVNNNIISCKVNFTTKEATVIFNNNISLRQVAELLTAVGYEPYISLQHIQQPKKVINKSKIYKLGVAGFCFANIMLLSFPEYLGIDAKEKHLQHVFNYLNLLLALPVFFYAQSEFYISAYKSLKHKFLNIDAPIVLSVTITFIRSVYEVVTNTGTGYFDSMSGIVFFMLVGRVLQDKTYESLNFERDYASYFPVAVTKIKNNATESITLPEIKLDDTLLIHNQEIIPADGIITKGSALIDYSFVTGESIPIQKEMGEIVYAGGKLIGSNIEILVIKEVAQSYLTRLWNKEELKSNVKNNNQRSFVHLLSKYFTWIVFTIAFVAALYWYFTDSSKIFTVITAILIIACPCALLISNTFTNGNILRRLGRNNFYLRNAQVIEDIANINYIVFDKTGTLTTGRYNKISYEGKPLTAEQKKKIAILAAQSNHPMSKAITQWAGNINTLQHKVKAYKELPGLGIEGFVDDDLISIGSAAFVLNQNNTEEKTTVYVSIEGNTLGKFIFANDYRKNITTLLKKLQQKFTIGILSGDNAGEKNYLQTLLGFNSNLLFNQKPIDKLNNIKTLQNKGYKVLMIGDGLNDAGALKQANVGIAVAENTNNFTPASDAILDAAQLPLLHKFIRYCKFNKTVVTIAFTVSAIYNVIGLYFAVQGLLKPVIAAILMPSSTISILLITYGLTNLKANLLKLK